MANMCNTFEQHELQQIVNCALTQHCFWSRPTEGTNVPDLFEHYRNTSGMNGDYRNMTGIFATGFSIAPCGPQHNIHRLSGRCMIFQRGRSPIIWHNFCWKLHGKEKHGLRGCVRPLRPLDQPMSRQSARIFLIMRVYQAHITAMNCMSSVQLYLSQYNKGVM